VVSSSVCEEEIEAKLNIGHSFILKPKSDIRLWENGKYSNMIEEWMLFLSAMSWTQQMVQARITSMLQAKIQARPLKYSNASLLNLHK